MCTSGAAAKKYVRVHITSATCDILTKYMWGKYIAFSPMNVFHSLFLVHPYLSNLMVKPLTTIISEATLINETLTYCIIMRLEKGIVNACAMSVQYDGQAKSLKVL